MATNYEFDDYILNLEAPELAAEFDLSPAATAVQGMRAGEQYVATSTWKTNPLAVHGGKGANLLLRWNNLPGDTSAIDVVLHLHGHIGLQPTEHMLRAVAERSGLDLSGRKRPTLAILPRGRRITEDEVRRRQAQLDELAKRARKKPEVASKDVYTFPALWHESGAGLEALIAGALQWLERQRGGAALPIARLIFTAHSGGGAALDRLVALHERRRACNPDEVHVFDALYAEADGLKSWVGTRLGAAHGGAGGLRIFYSPRRQTQKWSEQFAQVLPPSRHVLARQYRVECTSVDHFQMPNAFGPTLLGDVAADLPTLGSCAPAPAKTRRPKPGAKKPNPKPAPNEVDTRFINDSLGEPHMTTNYEWENDELDLAAEFAGDEEFGRFRRWPTRSYSPRSYRPRRPAPRPRPRPARRPPTRARRIYLYAPESPAASEYVRWVQTMLNQALDLQLPADGIMSVQTRSAIRSFQEKNGLPVSGIVGPDTEQVLLAPRVGKTPGAGAMQSVESGMLRPRATDTTPSEPGTVELVKPITPTLATEFDFEWESFNEESVNRYEASPILRAHPAKSKPKPSLFTPIAGGPAAGRSMPRHATRSELMFEPKPLSFQFEYQEGMESEDLTIIRQCDTAALKAIPLLEPRIAACGSTTVPIQRVRWLLDRSLKENAPNWVKRLKGDISNIARHVKVTIEIFRIIPVGANDLTATKEFRRYLDAKHILYAGGVAELGIRGSLERDLNISLSSLYQQAGVTKALPYSEYWSYRVLVYATFPDAVKDHLRPEDVYVLDKFRFNSWDLQPRHIEMIRTLARDVYEAAFYSNRMVKRVHVRGHTDERGSADFNYRLGEKRAKSVEVQLRKAMKAQAIAKNLPSSWFVALEKLEISVGSLGEDEPVSKTVHELNRRVEVIIEYTVAKVAPPVQLDEITSRLRKLLSNQRIIDAAAAQRLLCIVSKMKPGVDDRFFWAQAVLDADRTNKPFDPVNASRIRYDLVNPAFFGQNVGDEQVIKNAQRLLDDVVIAGIHKLRQLINYYSGAPAIGALVTGRGLRALDEWFQKQLKNPNSIYHCYKDF